MPASVSALARLWDEAMRKWSVIPTTSTPSLRHAATIAALYSSSHPAGIITLTKHPQGLGRAVPQGTGAPDLFSEAYTALRQAGSGLLTLEMVQAGILELIGRDMAEEPAAAIIRDLFQAIAEASPKSPCGPLQ